MSRAKAAAQTALARSAFLQTQNDFLRLVAHAAFAAFQDGDGCVKSSAMRSLLLGLTFSVLVFFAEEARSASRADAAFEKFANDFIGGYLGWRPAEGVSLGLHE